MTGKDYLEDAAQLLEQYETSVRADFEAIPDSRIWERPIVGQVSPANLVLHLTGNLRHFFGRVLGGSDYVRDRDREFLADSYATRAEILAGWEGACVETREVIASLGDSGLVKPAPPDQYPGGVPVHLLILRLVTHLTYHAGQIRSMRRLLAAPDA